MLEANFWQDKSNSQKVVKEKKLFEDLINSLNSSVKKLNDFEDLNQLALDENNSDFQGEIIQNIRQLKWYHFCISRNVIHHFVIG